MIHSTKSSQEFSLNFHAMDFFLQNANPEAELIPYYKTWIWLWNVTEQQNKVPRTGVETWSSNKETSLINRSGK